MDHVFSLSKIQNLYFKILLTNIYPWYLLQDQKKRKDTYKTRVKTRANLEGVDDPAFAQIISSLTMKEISWEQFCWRESNGKLYAHSIDVDMSPHLIEKNCN